MSRSQKHRTTITQKCVLGLALLMTAAVGAVSCQAPAPVQPAAEPLPVLVENLGDYRYEYHVPTGREFLFDATNDRRGLVNLMPGHEREAAACRQALETRLGPGGLEAMRAR
jgi:hypothetical protein